MTVLNSTAKVVATGNGVATVFSFSPMVIFVTTDVIVIKTVTATGVETILIEGTGATNYSVAPATTFPGTGSVTYPASGGTPLPATETLTIIRRLPLLQNLDLENQGGYLPEPQEQQLDKLVMIMIDIEERLNRAILINAALTPTKDQIAARTALKFLRWNATGDAVDAVDVATTDADASNITPVAVTTGAGAAGTAADFSREDHVHSFTEQAALLTANNLSEVTAATAVTNLGLLNTREVALEFFIDGGGSAITTSPNVKGGLYIPFDGVITAAILLVDQTGSIKIDIWNRPYATYPPGNANTITAANEPEIASGIKDKDETLTGWTVAVSKDDVLYFSVDSATTVQWCLVILVITKDLD